MLTQLTPSASVPLDEVVINAKAHPKKPKKKAQRWIVDQVMADEETASATSAMIMGANGLTNNEQSFHEIDWRSISIPQAKGMTQEFAVKPISAGAKGKPRPYNLRISLVGVKKSKRTAHVRAKITAWAVKNVGFSVVIGGPGARPQFAAIDRHLIKNCQVRFFTSEDADCVPASLCNAVMLQTDRCRGEIAMNIIKKVEKHGVSVASYANMIHQLKLGLQVRKPKCRHLKTFDGYDEKEDIIVVVRLHGSHGLDHVVVVDKKVGIIVDSEELFPLRMSSEALRLCAGNTRKSHITEVVQIALIHGN